MLPNPTPVVRVYAGENLQCSATGTPPIYMAIKRNSTVLANATGKAEIRLYKEGNYTCVAINKYGTDTVPIRVINVGKYILLDLLNS